MAIWQYKFRALPKESENVASEKYIVTSTKVEFDDEFFWKKHPVHRTFFNPIEIILIKSRSWSMDIDLYGDQESNCLEVVFDTSENVLSVSFRVDFRMNYENILRQLIEFFVLKGLIILDENLDVIPLNCEQMQHVITNSPQLRRYNELLR